VGNFGARLRYLYPNKKTLLRLALLCVPPAFFRVLVPAFAAAALDSRADAALPAAGGCAAGLLGWLCLRLARRLAAALAADSALRIRRRAFAEFLSREEDFPAEEAGVTEFIFPAAAFLRHILFLFFLAAFLVCAACFGQGPRLPALGALFAFPAAFLLARVLRIFSAAENSPSVGDSPASLVRALPAAKAPGGAKFLEEALHAAAPSPAPVFRGGLRGTAGIFSLNVCAAGLFLAGFAFAAAKLFPALSGGTWFFCLFAVPPVFLSAARLSAFPAAFRAASSAVEKLEAFFARTPSPRAGAKVSAFHLKGELEMRGLSVFSGKQKPEEQKLLDKISLKAAEGQKLALVGFSAESLACFARVAVRLREYDEGELLMDGKDIRTLDPASLREKIDFIPREPFLFADTLGENIRCGRPSASEEEILRAALRLGKGDWLHEIPDGLSAATPGPGKPLPSWAPFAALTRTLLKKPAICIIDEPLPLRDPFAEIRMQEAMYSIMSACTCLVIARRLSTLRRADRIIVFDGNAIAREGSHAGLLAEGGLYAKIYDAFFRHQSPNYFHEILEEKNHRKKDTAGAIEA
jgi:ABC-type iron transport system FetAB ATPase subunit